MIRIKRFPLTKRVEITIYEDFPKDIPSATLAKYIKDGEPGLSLASISVMLPEKDVPGGFLFYSHRGIPSEFVDEIVTALYDARRIAKGTLTVA